MCRQPIHTIRFAMNGREKRFFFKISNDNDNDDYTLSAQRKTKNKTQQSKDFIYLTECPVNENMHYKRTSDNKESKKKRKRAKNRLIKSKHCRNGIVEWTFRCVFRFPKSSTAFCFLSFFEMNSMSEEARRE